ncbi:14 kDa phosphohistidine phosphatase-like isoform X2 [Mercenaria mercenaria]|uniref:14 kDa phosphohistidine phosphatase-like isoform X2 n=1 Tax=Mercenaria mercenaria TaxID=6596 RepID=UPI00234F4F0F|nr:14 kDa phosphohistidine phosphatase-like isoform X2 [Mercenaria mercenaria]
MLRNFQHISGIIVRNLRKTMAVSQAEIQSPGSSKNPKLKAVPDVEIDKNGKFKYILIKVHDPSKEREFKHIVRGTAKAAFHGDIFDEVTPAIEEAGLDCECLGGGRIHHDTSKKKIEIFGYSQGYGQANHSITARILSKKYRDYDNITWNNDGY